MLLSVVLAAGIVGLLAIYGPEARQTTGAATRTDISAPSDSLAPIDSIAQEVAGLPQPSAISIDELSQTRVQTRLATLDAEIDGAATDVAMAEASRAGETSGAAIAAKAQAADAASAEAGVADAPHAEPARTEQAQSEVQVANANPLDDSFTFKDLAEILRRADMGAKAFGFIAHSCTANDSCDVDQYLWALYQRTPKEDAVRQVELKEITVEGKGKNKTEMVTITQASSNFGWKDPKAAERMGMSLKDYVIGGMDPSFKLKLYNMFRAAEAAGFSPGITSGFRDDYRQSIASGMKAASNMSYHGGSKHGGYGHGVAADVVNVAGGSRDMRFVSSSMFWNWIDAYGHAYGIGRPYLGRDPPHVAPIDGAEYAKHNPRFRLATTDAKLLDLSKSLGVKKEDAKKLDDKKAEPKKTKRAATRDASRPAKRPRTATASKEGES